MAPLSLALFTTLVRHSGHLTSPWNMGFHPLVVASCGAVGQVDAYSRESSGPVSSCIWLLSCLHDVIGVGVDAKRQVAM